METIPLRDKQCSTKPFGKSERCPANASGASRILTRPKFRFLIEMAMLLAVVFPFITAGCDNGSSNGTSESSAPASSGTTTEWASLYDDQFALYGEEIPGSISCDLVETTTGEEESFCYYDVSVPTLSVFLPPEDIATGAAVIVCPAGGYWRVWYGSGVVLAEALAENGIAAFLLKYRLPNALIMADKSIGPLQDAQEAIKTVRQRASEWDVDPERVGIMGYSTGGHVAVSGGIHYNDVCIDNEAAVNLRPAFIILVSALVSMDEKITHAVSRTHLLGDDPDPELLAYFSAEQQVTADTPPVWTVHAADDTVVRAKNSEWLFDALGENGVSAELVLYATGGHYFFEDTTETGWLTSMLGWLKTMGMIPS